MNLDKMNMQPVTPRDLATFIRTYPDFPRPGIQFKDISPLLADPCAFGELIDRMSHEVKAAGCTKVVGLESRGFILGVAVAQRLGLPFIPARKGGKLPGDLVATSYSLEYGTATLELQRDAVGSGDRVAVVDDLLATGGTAKAAGALVERVGGEVGVYVFAIELAALDGRAALGSVNIKSVMEM